MGSGKKNIYKAEQR